MLFLSRCRFPLVRLDDYLYCSAFVRIFNAYRYHILCVIIFNAVFPASLLLLVINVVLAISLFSDCYLLSTNISGCIIVFYYYNILLSLCIE